MTALLKRVKSHCTGQATSGQNTLALTLECIEHMRDNQNEWSALAYLIGKSQPTQSRMVRKITGRVLQGWQVKKDDAQPSGLRFVKLKGQNQGYDEAQMEGLKCLVQSKASVQSKIVVQSFTPEKAEPKPVSELDMAKRIVKILKDKNISNTGSVISMMQVLLSGGEVEPNF